jgi:hypothetical protein
MTGFWFCVGVCTARALRPITATVTSIAAITRTVGLAPMVFITPRLPALWMAVKRKRKIVLCRCVQLGSEVSPYRATVSVGPVANRLTAFLTDLDVYETSRARVSRRSEAISVRVNRPLPRSVDRLVTGPIADEGASSRS